MTSTTGTVLDIAAGTTSLTRTILNMVDGTAYPLKVTATSGGTAGQASPAVSVTPATPATPTVMQTSSIVVVGSNYNAGTRLVFIDALRGKAVFKATPDNAIALETAPNANPNTNANGFWTGAKYQVPPGQEILVTGGADVTQQWMVRLLDNATTIGQKIIIEQEFTV